MHGLHCNSPIYDPHIDGMTGAHQHAQLFLLRWDHENFFALAGLEL
jgi:hypothetical protein